MSLISPFQERYLFGVQTSGISNAVTFDASVVAEETGKPLLRATTKPSLDPGFQILDTVKATGLSVRDIQTGSEFQSGVQRPTLTIEFDATPNNLALFFWLLFQKGATENALLPYVKTYVPYTTPDAEVWASVVYLLSTSTAGENIVMHGAICRSLTLASSETDQLVKATAELIGYSWAATYDASTAVTAAPAIEPLLFKNMTFQIGSNAVNIPSFTLTINNNAEPRYFHAANPVKYVLGKLEVTGEIEVPRDSGAAAEDNNAQFSDFVALTPNKLTFYWGATPAASNGDVSLILNALYTGAEKVGDVEIGTRLPFQHVYDGTTNVSFTLADNLSRGIP